MTLNGWAQIAIYAALIIVTVKPLGAYMARVFTGERTFLSLVLEPVERGLYRLCGVDEKTEQHWTTYTVAMLLASVAGFVVLCALQRLQAVLPFNPQGQSGVEERSAFNTAMSFMTNTNWQGYGGETTMSYVTQMAGLTVQNFVSAATGIALAIALIRGFARRSAQTVGNFWVDLVRCTLYLLLPISIVVGLVSRLAGGAAEPQRLRPKRPRSKAPNRYSPRGRWLRRWSSRSWAPTAAASSMPTPRIRTRTRTRSPTLSSWS
jgi:K+-transporting ATPase ATPase A chain